MHERLPHARAQFVRRDFAAAEREARAVLHDDPTNRDAIEVLGRIHVERREYDEAQQVLLAACTPRRPHPDSVALLATICNRTGRHEAALRMADLAIKSDPRHVDALVESGIALRALGQFEHAVDALDPVRDDARAAVELAAVHLRHGDFVRGLPLFERRRQFRPVGVGLAEEEWRGESRPEARLLVLPEGGLSEFLLMSRFFPMLADRFERVVVLAPGPLARLVATIDPRLEVVRSLPDARFDVWTCAGSLPLRLGVRRPEDLPVEPWIRVEASAAPVSGPGVRIGINWAGDPSHPSDAIRSTPLRALAPLLEVQGIDWVSLHRGARQDEAKGFRLPRPLEDAKDFLDTAKVIAGLDVVVSTESTVAHLAAAMGVRTCVLATQNAHWCWPGWYADAQLCPQREAGNWNGPMSDVAGMLLTLPVAA